MVERVLHCAAGRAVVVDVLRDAEVSQRVWGANAKSRGPCDASQSLNVRQTTPGSALLARMLVALEIVPSTRWPDTKVPLTLTRA